MRLAEALKLIQKGSPESAPFEVLLACGCSPLHLKTFLHAHLQERLPHRRISVAEGRYGDIVGTLERSGERTLQAIAVTLEWSDLDSRLGYRSTGRWSIQGIGDIAQTAGATLARLGEKIQQIAPEVRMALSLPTLPLPPLFQTTGWQASELELELEDKLASFSAAIARRANLAIVNQRRLAEESPFATRFDLKSEILIGFPYTNAHADALAALCARLLAPTAPKKGIITDLDNTLWNGIVGEVGPEGVSWDFGQHDHLHALYQNLLASLSEQGVLVAVASKNDPGVVERAFQRTDLLLQSDRVFPFEVHWQAKSGSVGRVLEAWNVAADSVIFVDDSPMELAEVAAQHPGIQCLEFPKGDYAAGMALLREIRDLCGKERVSQEDGLRLDSIRKGAEFRRMAEDGAVPEDFLAQVDAVVTIDFEPAPGDSRVLDLVNKTNQFNLNGLRRTEADWTSQNQNKDGLVAVINYEDKFGPLGKIAVLQGTRNGTRLDISTWVMSCRAFSRRIEHQCIRVLFERFGATEIRFDFAATPRNGPLQDFFEGLLGERPAARISLTRAAFEGRCPALFHRVVSEK